MASLSRHLISLLLAALFVFAGCSSSRMAQDPVSANANAPAFRESIDRILADTVLRPVVTSMKIVALKTGDVLYERNADLLMRPASNMKLLTTAAALIRLGPKFAFTTRFYSDGYVRDSVLYGNLYVKGGGDPDFSSAAIAAIVAEQKSKAGIKRVEGDLVGDDTYFDAQRWGTGWMWDDEPWGYAAFNSALSINRNCVDVRVTPSNTVGAPPIVTIEPDTRYVSVENTAVTAGMNTMNTLEISRKFFERSNTITICGALPLGTSASHETITVLHPEQYFL
ncbi:MAG TPA: D-alanyl-D-alanine carboxypeptidase/D-alanyl-D-alanine-endopeptidase, partial [Bacteroidota bacterium]|nr:D-alanyl-D-alanine carboxypeptidase/D-alanyl-D-alanine-endopeptidase [Bacteroidota bacterium]